MNKKEAIIDKLKLDPRGVSRKGWYTTDCPYCGTKQKFGVRFNDDPRFKQWNSKVHKNKISFNCYSGSCSESGTGNKLLKVLGLSHLISDIEYLEDKVIIPSYEEEEVQMDTPTMIKPIGFKRVFSNTYLDDRGFESWQYELYHIGVSRMIRDRVIFLIIENGENKGYVARTTMEEKEIKRLKNKGVIIPKYKNQSVDFDKLVYGIDEVEEGDSVIIVEGVTDKANVDRMLRVLGLGNVKCVCTFGKKISLVQFMKIKNRNTNDILFLYDFDAINESKKYSHEASDYFKNVKVGLLLDKDPGDISLEEFISVIENSMTAQEFSNNTVSKIKLK